MMSETKQETKEKKQKKQQAQAESQLTYDPNNPDPHWRRRQFAVPGGAEKKKEEKNG